MEANLTHLRLTGQASNKILTIPFMHRTSDISMQFRIRQPFSSIYNAHIQAQLIRKKKYPINTCIVNN